MPDDEVLCSLTEQGNFGLGVGEVTNKKDQEAIRAMQRRQKEVSDHYSHSSSGRSSCSSHHCMDD
jgi:hypothetical protein